MCDPRLNGRQIARPGVPDGRADPPAPGLSRASWRRSPGHDVARGARHRRRRHGRRHVEHDRRHRAPLPAGLADQADGGVGGDRRRRGGHRRPRRAAAIGRARRGDAATSARPRRRLRVRRRRADRPLRRAAGSTPTRASSAPPTSRRRPPAWRSATICARRCWEPLGMATHDAARAHRRTAPAAVRPTLARFVGEMLRPRLLADDDRRDVISTQFPELAGIVPDVGRFDPCPWGLGVRDPWRQDAALDRSRQLAAHVRALRRVRNDDVGRSVDRCRRRRPHRSTVRRVARRGARAVAAVLRRRRRREAAGSVSVPSR